MENIFALLLLLFGPLVVFAAPSVNTESLAKDIEKQGAVKVILRLYASEEKEWRYVTEQIVQGDDR